LQRDEFLKVLYAYFKTHGKVPSDTRIRDSIVEALSPNITAVPPPIPGIVSEEDAVRVARYHGGETDAESFEKAIDEALRVFDAFRTFHRDQGQNAYVVWSEAFYDDPENEEEKVYRCPIEYPFPRFAKKYGMTGLLASADTVLLRPDFRHLVVLFHHGWYEFHDAEFAKEFLRYCSNRRAS
jgi:hypothetical protein